MIAGRQCVCWNPDCHAVFVMHKVLMRVRPLCPACSASSRRENYERSMHTLKKAEITQTEATSSFIDSMLEKVKSGNTH